MTSASTPPPPKTPQPLGDQLTDLLLKIIKPGGLAVGGLGAVWLLFAESDLPRAIASATIGVLISYGAKLLQPIHEGNQRRLEEAGKAIDRGIDMALAQPSKKRFEDQYLDCQGLECQAARSEGMAQHAGLFTPLLTEVFVPLELAPDAISPGFRQTVLEKMQTTPERPIETMDIWEFLSRTPKEPMFRQLAILAWGGFGKTTLLKHVTYLYSTRQQPRSAPRLIPILLVLRKYRDLLSQAQPPSLPDLITEHHIPSLPGAADLSRVPPEWAHEILNRGEALVLLDGFDEITKAQRPGVAHWLNEQLRQYNKSVFILTSRPKAYQGQDVSDRLQLSTSLWVKNFDAPQRKAFVDNWYLCQERYAHGGRTTPDVQHIAAQAAAELLDQIEARPELRDLAKNPLLLNMIVTFHRRYPGAELPKRRVELYREMCLLQLRDRPAARKLETLLTQCDAQTVLQMLAFFMMRNRRERVKHARLLQWLEKYLRQQGETVEAAEFLEQIVQISELLVQQEDQYEFAHLSFQEYLAATYVAQTKREYLLYGHLKDDWWKQTLLLYAAQVNPSNLIREALQRGATDLAYTFWQDTTKRLDPVLEAELKALKQTVQSSRYEALHLYLQKQQWREADQETYRLMITTVGKEYGQLFTEEELASFPRDELQAIDALWMKYSQGKWGFSVQKRIWQACDRPLEYNETTRPSWERFGDLVGWRKHGDWLSYSDLVFDLQQSHSGEFPFLFGLLVVGGWVGCFLGSRALLSRDDW